MIELIARAAAAAPERYAVVTDDAVTTYRELLQRAAAIASALRNRGIERFAIVDHDAVSVIALLAGASAIGVEACQLPPTAEVPDLVSLVQRFDFRHVVIGADVDVELPGVERIAPTGLGTAALQSEVDDVLKIAASTPVRELMTLTTGTTGAPRGVVHDWSRLVRGTRHVTPAPSARWLLAYGLHQYAGLQVVLHVLASGGVLVAPVPRRPREGLAAMRRHAVDHVSATPTYWRFVLAELGSDGGAFPDLRQITLGGEAVPGPLLDELRTTFPDAHVTQVYAGSEFGTTGAVRDGRRGLSLDVLTRGEDADVALKIVDGELWVRSRIGMVRYFGEPPADPDGWRPTGDLVEIVSDRICFRGRSTDIINVGGTKVHPFPVEERLAGLSQIAVARVYGRPNRVTGAIVAVEAVLAPDVDESAGADAIRNACADLPPEARPRSIRFVESVAMVHGKLARGGASA